MRSGGGLPSLSLRDAGSTEESAAEAGKSAQAAMRKQIADLQRRLAVVQVPDGVAFKPEVITFRTMPRPPRFSMPLKWRSSSLTLTRSYSSRSRFSPRPSSPSRMKCPNPVPF